MNYAYHARPPVEVKDRQAAAGRDPFQRGNAAGGARRLSVPLRLSRIPCRFWRPDNIREEYPARSEILWQPSFTGTGLQGILIFGIMYGSGCRRDTPLPRAAALMHREGKMTKYKLAKLIAMAGGLRSRKRVQKMVYLLQSAGCDFDADFGLHYYGPYSRDVAELLDRLTSEEILIETPRRFDHGHQYDYQFNEKFEAGLELFETTPQGAAEKAGLDAYARGNRRVEVCRPEGAGIGCHGALLSLGGPSVAQAVEETCDFKKRNAQTRTRCCAPWSIAKRMYRSKNGQDRGRSSATHWYNYIVIDRQHDEWLIELLDTPKSSACGTSINSASATTRTPGPTIAALLTRSVSSTWCSRRGPSSDHRGDRSCDRARPSPSCWLQRCCMTSGTVRFRMSSSRACRSTHEVWSCRIIRSPGDRRPQNSLQLRYSAGTSSRPDRE